MPAVLAAAVIIRRALRHSNCSDRRNSNNSRRWPLVVVSCLAATTRCQTTIDE